MIKVYFTKGRFLYLKNSKFTKCMLKISKGFTLIELLVVIAIIGLLAAVVFVSFGNVQEDAREARRRADMTQIKTAMELCFADISCSGSAGAYVTYNNMGSAQTGGIGTYVSAGFLPSDPSGGAYVWFDNTANDTIFCVTATLEGGGTINASEKGVGPNC